MKKIVTFLMFISSVSSFAYYSTFDTGELVKEGRVEALLETQFVTDNNSGMNLNARADYGLNDESSFRALLGFGATDFQIGGFYKWVPIPDYKDQPAIGLSAGVMYARYSGENELALRLHPFLSKKFEIDHGMLTPYAALPVGLRSFDGENQVPIQFQLGTRFKHNDIKHIAFNAELGFNVKDAFTYISFGAVFALDEDYGFQFK